MLPLLWNYFEWLLAWSGSRADSRYARDMFISYGGYQFSNIDFSESFSVVGTIFGVFGSISLSLCSISTKKTLPAVGDDVLLLNYYANIYAIFLFIPLMIFTGEVPIVINYENLGKLWFWSAIAIGGICGFSVGTVTSLQIKFTSPLTHNISGTAKACAQTIIATQWNNESKSLLWWFSNFIVLAGSSMYTRVKQIEMNKSYQKLNNQNV